MPPEPVVVQEEETQIEGGFHLRKGNPTLTRNGKDCAVFHALVEFVSASVRPWSAGKATFSTKGPDGKTAGLTVVLLNEA
ncbi:hypothetical protein ACFVUW_11590 [Streptomyces xiamenensis]|uniref:hypothetical protein n=1 Tax=Streptomyces xiamenensis TaxID=408015 RepID=UPI0036E200C5